MNKYRKHYLTHPRFQAAFAFAFIRGALISVFFPACALFLTVYLLAQDPSFSILQKAALLQEVNNLVILFFWIVVGLCVIFGVMGFYLSYKFVGPVRRLEDWLIKNVGNIKTEALKLRPGDELSPVVNVLNRLFYR